METRVRIFMKLVLAVVLAALFIWLIYRDQKSLELKQPEGELVRLADVRVLIKELAAAGGDVDESALEELCESALTEEMAYLNYDTYLKIINCLLLKEEQGEDVEKFRERISYQKKYKGEFLVLEKDWYESYGRLVEYFGLEEAIREEKIEILCGNGDLAGEEKIGEGCVLAVGGKIYECQSGDFEDLKFSTVKAYVREKRLLTLREITGDKSQLSNVWIMEAAENSIQFFYRGYEILADTRLASENPALFREQVGDIVFWEGEARSLTVKNERISGKLLGISRDTLEVEGYGMLSIKENCVGYKLFEELREAEKSELLLGYDFSDFVLEDGEVCAFLNTRKEKMETIRVAVKNNGFAGLYHDKIVLASKDDMSVYYGTYQDRKQEIIAAGQELVIEEGSKYLEGNRVEIAPVVNTGKIEVTSLERNQGTPAYRGRIEVVRADQGLALINEVLLEEYLYSVVPSEMPASYPIEALKAQAVCARTYGYRYLAHPGYGSLGAHVDDSVGYQVYNNIAENVNSTKAVKETAGELLFYEDEPVSTYYYSTSCGFGADAGVWNESQREELPYLRSVHIGEAESSSFSPQELAEEDNFREYIMQTDDYAYEREEAWFRWHYQVEELSPSRLYERLKERQSAGKVLTFTGASTPEEEPEAFEERELKQFREVYNICCFKRKEGGVMDELLIETDKGVYKVVSEYNIRYVLNLGGEIIRQDGKPASASSLLPSAYFVIDIEKSGEGVVGYTIVGGGYGHGVGMSQNGARAMGAEGKDCGEILSFYYKDCRLGKVY